jgi:exopolysaccharide biosynthesis WecB/TagA/CpsF family protein
MNRFNRSHSSSGALVGRQHSLSFWGLDPAKTVRLAVTPSAGVDLTAVTPAQAASRLAGVIRNTSGKAGLLTVAFMNMRNFVAAKDVANAMAAFAAVDEVYPDGVGLQIARYLLGLGCFPRVSGTETVPLLLEQLEPGTRVFLLGGTEHMSKALEAGFSRRFPELVLAGTHHGYITPSEDDGVVAAIFRARPNVLLIGMGSPLQETWLKRNRHRLPGKLAVCVGGLFHYWAGDLRRAPAAMRGLGLEWVWIVAQQPQKWRVYSIDAARFVATLLRLRQCSR